MLKNIYSLIFIFTTLLSYAQSTQDNLGSLLQEYQSALGLIYQSQAALPQDSVLMAQEMKRLKANYKQAADSILKVYPDAGPYFELQRRIDAVNFAEDTESRNQHLDALYQHAAQHQMELVDNGMQLNKIAQCLMGVNDGVLRSEIETIQRQAKMVNEFYQHLDTSGWELRTHQTFFGYFASQYSNMSNIGMAEKFYRQFEDLIIDEKPFEELKSFSLPENISYVNGFLQPKNRINYNYTRPLIIINPQQESLLDLVYIIRTLWAFDKTHRPKYDAVLLRNTNRISDEFLIAIKNNLAFGDYYIANYPSRNLKFNDDAPAYMLVDREGQVTFQTNNIIAFFKNLNEPIEASELANDKKREKQKALRQKRQDSLAVLPADTTQRYTFEHDNITFTLSGKWEDELSSELSPVQWSEKNTATNTSIPYLAVFSVKHPKYPVYQQIIMVTDAEQKIHINSDQLSQKQLEFEQEQHEKIHESLENIDICLAEQANYNYLINAYPFQNTDFIKSLKAKSQQIGRHIQAIADDFENKKVKAILRKYVNEKAEQLRAMM